MCAPRHCTPQRWCLDAHHCWVFTFAIALFIFCYLFAQCIYICVISVKILVDSQTIFLAFVISLLSPSKPSFWSKPRTVWLSDGLQLVCPVPVTHALQIFAFDMTDKNDLLSNVKSASSHPRAKSQTFETTELDIEALVRYLCVRVSCVCTAVS